MKVFRWLLGIPEKRNVPTHLQKVGSLDRVMRIVDTYAERNKKWVC